MCRMRRTPVNSGMLHSRQGSAEAIFSLNPAISKREAMSRDTSGKGLGRRWKLALAWHLPSSRCQCQQCMGVRLATICNGVLGKGFHGEALLPCSPAACRLWLQDVLFEVLAPERCIGKVGHPQRNGHPAERSSLVLPSAESPKQECSAEHRIESLQAFVQLYTQ